MVALFRPGDGLTSSLLSWSPSFDLGKSRITPERVGDFAGCVETIKLAREPAD
jgi:hypothetical protein